MVKIRKLEEKDAPLMLEWMQDQELVKFLSKDFSHMELSDCLRFIRDGREDGENVHRAICSEQDEYLGTVSLKQTEEILKLAFEELGLHRVYLNVVGDNVRADRFYEKMAFRYEGTFKEHMFVCGRYRDLKWYGITRQEYEAAHEPR